MRGVLTDIDDTLTTDGAITPDALEALAQLRDAGLKVVAVTGRSMGWSEPFARTWPLDAIVAENGAVALFKAHGGDGLTIEYAQDAATRERNALRLREAAERVLREIPGAALAADSAGRVTDIAVDHAEHAHLSPAEVARAVALLRGLGLTATVSSIHVNAWIGAHDKLSGARWIVQRLYGVDLDAEADDWLAVGDSPNDQALFARFSASVGVANLRRWADALTVWPAWIADGERGAGFAEVARALIEARNA